MATKKNLTTDVKRRMICDAIVITERVHRNIEHLVGVPLANFNYDAVLEYIRDLNKEYKYQNGEDYHPVYRTKYKK